MTPCLTPGCPTLVPSGHCDQHTPKRTRARNGDAHRPSAARRGYSTRWQAARLRYLRHHPTCTTPHCRSRADVVDHIVRAREAGIDFWDQSNWQALCTPCHARKSGIEAHEPLTSTSTAQGGHRTRPPRRTN